MQVEFQLLSVTFIDVYRREKEEAEKTPASNQSQSRQWRTKSGRKVKGRGILVSKKFRTLVGTRGS